MALDGDLQLMDLALLIAHGLAVVFVVGEGAGAGEDLQLDFLEKNVIQGKKRIIEAWISDPDVWKGSQLKSLKDIYN